MSGRALRTAWPAIAIAAAMLVPFLGTAYTIDDPLFLYQAQHLLADPLHPTAFEINWSTEPHRMSALMASGPGMAYLLLPTIALGGAEWAAHLTQLALLVAALLATASLALRLGLGEREAHFAACLLASTPAVLGMAATAMPDVAAMAFGVLGIERAVAWAQEGRWHQAAAASGFLAAAALCRSHLIVLVAIAVIAVGRSRRAWLPPLVAPLLVALALIVTRDPQADAGAVAGAARTFVFAPALLRNVVAYFIHVVLVFPLAVPWLVLRPRAIVTSPVTYVAGAAAFLYVRSTTDVGPLWAAPAAGIGLAVVWDLLRRRDRTTLLFGVWILTPLVVVPYLHLPSKYLLAAAPAIALAVARQLEGAAPGRVRAALTIAVVPGLLLGVAILRADDRFAELGRRAAQDLVRPRTSAGLTVWFNGHWGFHWYAERAGARTLTATPPHPRWGDFVIASRHAEDELMAAMPHRRLVASQDDARPGGRTMSRAEGAGFFSNGWGYLPWAWGSDPVDRYEVWVIERPSTRSD